MAGNTKHRRERRDGAVGTSIGPQARVEHRGRDLLGELVAHGAQVVDRTLDVALPKYCARRGFAQAGAHSHTTVDENDGCIDNPASPKLRADLGRRELAVRVCLHGAIGDDVETRHAAQCRDDLALEPSRERRIAGRRERQHGHGARIDDDAVRQHDNGIARRIDGDEQRGAHRHGLGRRSRRRWAARHPDRD